MNVLDVCAGIGSFTEASKRAGLNTVCQIEIDPYRQKVLAKQSPDALRLGDIYGVQSDDIPYPIDVICGGTPCQDLSIAGYGKGLAGKKSRLWFEYLRLAQALKPQWLVWENVPNALSSNGGRDFATILRGLDECGYCLAWRVLDAQYFGVPQRRRRIFLVGHLRDGRAAKVLFERESVPGNSQTRPKAWKEATRTTGTLSKRSGGISWDGDGNESKNLIAQPLRTETYDARNHRLNGDISGTLQAKKSGGYSLNYQNPVIVNTYRMQSFGNYSEDDTASAIKRRDAKQGTDLVIDLQQVTSKTNQSKPNIVAGSMTTKFRKVTWNPDNLIIRRLTPMECGRLQGFPDGYLDGLGLSDTKKYEMWGDTIALPCSEWIMRRIALLHADEKEIIS